MTYDWNAFNSTLLEHIKSNLSCLELVRHEGRLAPRQYAKDSMWVHCPHPEHEDNNPSCKVWHDGFTCYACQAKGDVFTLVGYFDSTCNFRGQIEEALTRLGLSIEEERARFVTSQREGTVYVPGECSTRFKAPKPRTPRTQTPQGITDTTREIWERVLAPLSLDEDAARYLEEERGLWSGLCMSVGIRSATLEEWSSILEEVAKDYTLAELQESGLYTTSQEQRAQGIEAQSVEELVCHPCLPKMLVMPYRVRGILQGLRFRQQGTSYYGGARYLSPIGAHNVAHAPYLSSRDHLPMFGASRRVLYVHEAELDALSTAQCGRASLGMSGARSWRKVWGTHFDVYDTIVLCMDDDSAQKAGDQASRLWADIIKTDLAALHGQDWVDHHVIESCAIHTDPTSKDHNDLLRRGVLEQHLHDIEHGLMA